MKKILTLIVFICTAFFLIGCFDENTTIEFVSVPNSLYNVKSGDALASAITAAKDKIKIKVNSGSAMSLTQAEQEYGSDFVVTGLDFSTEGKFTLSISYQSVTIYYQYTVVSGTVNIPSVEPITKWYDDYPDLNTYTISTLQELYGLAELVNERGITFADKTVNLGADIDLTNSVWIPIGEGARKVSNLLGTKTTTTDTASDDLDTYVKSLNTSYVVVKDAQNEYIDCLGNKTVPDGYALIKEKSSDTEPFGYAHLDGLTWKVYECVTAVEANNAFRGTFDGKNHTIKGLSDIGYNPNGIAYMYVNSYTLVKGYVFGLFGRVTGNATIKNLKMIDVAISGSYINSDVLEQNELDSAGAFIGYFVGEGNKAREPLNTLTCENCQAISGSISGYDAIGGIIGRSYYAKSFIVKDCTNYLSVQTINKAGGIIGYGAGMKSSGNLYNSNGQFINCINYGKVVNSSTTNYKKCFIGGIISYVGSVKGVLYSECINYGAISTKTSNGNIGGLYTNQNVKKIVTNTNSINYGTVTRDGKVETVTPQGLIQ